MAFTKPLNVLVLTNPAGYKEARRVIGEVDSLRGKKGSHDGFLVTYAFAIDDYEYYAAGQAGNTKLAPFDACLMNTLKIPRRGHNGAYQCYNEENGLGILKYLNRNGPPTIFVNQFGESRTAEMLDLGAVVLSNISESQLAANISSMLDAREAYKLLLLETRKA